MSNFKNMTIWLVMLVSLFVLWGLFRAPGTQGQVSQIIYSQFLEDVEGGRIRDVVFDARNIHGHYVNGAGFSTYAVEDPSLLPLLREQKISITVQPQNSNPIWGLLISWFPLFLLIAFWVFFMRQMQGGSSKAFGFGKSRARMLTERHGRITFDDVAGIDEAKEDLQEIVEFLKEPQKFQRLGGRIPRGALLIGPPGTGKTLLARAIAGEANVPFFTISGSDFVEMFVGVGASRVRDMFEQAKKNAPCIIFIDEIDAVGRHRGAGLGGGNDEREQTLNQLLVEMDGFESNEGVILVAATNRPDVLDPALLRPGRFDRQVNVPNPDIIGREKIIKVHIRKTPLSPDVNLRTIARGTPGFSGADLANLVNESALLAARRGRRFVTMAEFEDAKDKVMMGAERRSMIMAEDEKRLTAYHEGGHALVSLHMEDSDPIHKATIIPRGRALGMVMRLPERDHLSVTRAKLKADIAVAMGGRVAEELVFGDDKVTSGASSDIKMATQMARAMVTRFGMSEKIGPLAYGDNEEEIFLGHAVARTQNMSEETQRIIDSEIHATVDEGYRTAHRLIGDYRDQLEIIAKGLLEYETLTGEEIADLLKGKQPYRDDGDDDEAPSLTMPSVPRTGKRPEAGGDLIGDPNPSSA